MVTFEVFVRSFPGDHSHLRSTLTEGVVLLRLGPALDRFSGRHGLRCIVMRVIRQLLILISDAVEHLVLF